MSDQIGKEKASHHKVKPVVTIKTGQPIDQAPDYLGIMGKMVYNKIVADLKEMGVADRADSRAVEAYASAYEEYRLARKVCMEKGFTMDIQALDEEGKVYVEKTSKRPECDVMNAAWTRMKSLLVDLYLTPSARAKVPGSGTQKVGEDWSDLIPDDKKGE